MNKIPLSNLCFCNKISKKKPEVIHPHKYNLNSVLMMMFIKSKSFILIET